MRVLSLLLRITGYIAICVTIVLAFGLFAALLPSLWQLVQPSDPETYDIGLVSLVAGSVGVFVGIWPAIVGVEWLVKINDRRVRERSLRSNKSQA
jgi:hypothetical protein